MKYLDHIKKLKNTKYKPDSIYSQFLDNPCSHHEGTSAAASPEAAGQPHRDLGRGQTGGAGQLSAYLRQSTQCITG